MPSSYGDSPGERQECKAEKCTYDEGRKLKRRFNRVNGASMCLIEVVRRTVQQSRICSCEVESSSEKNLKLETLTSQRQVSCKGPLHVLRTEYGLYCN